MTGVRESYLENRTPLQSVTDRVEVAVAAGGTAAALYLFFVERPDDFGKIQGVNAEYLAGTCPEVKCGTEATDKMMRNEYYGVDGLGSIALAVVASFAAAHRAASPTRWLRKQTARNQ